MAIDPRRSYMDVGTSTASPEKLLTMLWDRLILDLDVARQALADQDLATVNDRLVHAQDIVLELRSTLRADAWEGGPGLASLYSYVATRLVTANLGKDVAVVEECRELLAPLRDAFHEAARTVSVQRLALVDSA